MRDAPYVTPINSLKGIDAIKITSGSDFNVMLDNTGKIYSWGFNNYGQLGNTSKLINGVPKVLHVPGNKPIRDVDCGDNFCMALDTEGHAYSWGCGSSGQLGHGNTSDLSVPSLINFPKKIESISCGEAHSA